jgi:nifR3 family TIM-barrel protein
LQLFGDNEDEYKKSIEENDLSFYSFIDINMGCPTKKVVKNGGGSALLTDTDKMISILKAAKSASKIPVSVKIRLGYSRGEGGYVERALALKEEGCAFISVHGRYATDMYRGTADWDSIAEIKQALGDFIVIGNGDIKTKEEALKAFETSKVDGIMVGRAAVGCPWIFQELNSIFDESINYKKISIRDLTIKHLKGCAELYGETSGVHFMRKFVMKYLGYTDLDKNKKVEFMQCESINDVIKLLDKFNIN